MGSQMGWAIMVAVQSPVDKRNNQYVDWDCGFAPVGIFQTLGARSHAYVLATAANVDAAIDGSTMVSIMG
eukprot:10255944-Lingulodinium_polyedra.AAC.1